MTLIDWVVRRAFENSNITIALFMRDQEVVVGGYQRIAPNWRLTDRTAATSVTFGPYTEPVSYDRYVLFDGDEQVETIREESVAAFPRGFSWEWKPEIRLGD